MLGEMTSTMSRGLVFVYGSVSVGVAHDHQVWVVEVVLGLDLHVRHKNVTTPLACLGFERGEEIAGDAVVVDATARHGVDLIRDVFVPNLAVLFGCEVLVLGHHSDPP